MADQDDLIISISTDLTSVKRQLNKLVGDVDSATSQISRKWDAAGKNMDKSMTTALQSRIDAMVGIGKQATQEWNGALADQGKQLEALRAKYNPLFATIKQYQAAQSSIRTLYRSGTIDINEYTAAMARERQATLASIAALKSRNSVISRPPTSGAASAGAPARPWQTGNIVSQLQDIGVGVQGGQKPLTIALQQGTQLADVLQTFGSGKGVVAGLGAAFTSLVNPVQLVTIGLIAGGAALVQYFLDAKDNTKKVDDLLKAHSATIATIKDRYGEAAAGVQEYAKDSEAVTLAQARQNLKDAYAAVGKEASNLASGGPALLTALAPNLKDLPDQAMKLQRAFVALGASVRSGKPDLLAFQDALAQISNDESTPEAVREAIKNFGELDENTKKLASSIPGMVDALKAIGGAAGDQIDRVAQLSSELKKLNDLAALAQTPGEQISSTVNAGLSKLHEFTSGGTIDEDARRRLIIAGQRAQQAEDNKSVDMGDGRRVLAPTPEARPNIELDGLPGEVEKQEAAAKKAASAIEELKKKQDDLMRTAGDKIAQTQQEIDLTGKYGVAADKARFALEEWQKAEKLSLTDDQKKALQEKIDQYGKLAEQLANVKLSQDLADKARMRTLSPQEQQVSQQLRQYGLPDDLNSPQAKAIRKSMQIDDASDTVKGFLTNFRDDVVKDGGSIGKAFAESIKQSFLDILTKASDTAIQSLVNKVMGALFGGGSGSGAATGGAAVGLAGKLFSGSGAAPVIPVTRAPLASIPTTDVASYIAKAATARGIDPNTALAVAKSEGGLSSWNLQSGYFKNGVQEQSFGPFQLYKGGGLGNVFQKQTGLDPADASSAPAGVDFALDYAKKNGWGSWYGAKNSGIGNWQGIGSGGGMNSAADAVNKLADASKDASQGLGSFGTGLDKLGSGIGNISLSPNSGSAVGASGGLWGGIGKLFGGISPTSSLWAPNTTYGAFLGLADGGHVMGPGSGTSDSIPAWLSNGEFVVNAGATKKNRKLLEAINGGKAARFATGGLVSSRVVQAPTGPSLETPAARGTNGGQPGILQVHISGASGDDHVRTLVKQGVSEGLSSYNQNQVRGGFGSNQNQWQNRRS